MEDTERRHFGRRLSDRHLVLKASMRPVEAMIGLLTIALATTAAIPNESIVYRLMNVSGRWAWVSVLVMIGGFAIAVAWRGGKQWRLRSMMLIGFVWWSILGLFAAKQLFAPVVAFALVIGPVTLWCLLDNLRP